ncbi:MAG: carbohydrate ABC transporter permease [Anaerolineae bacterium]|nr:carbohydrate ABC transporter permease [Anaerolineae bacterium]
MASATLPKSRENTLARVRRQIGRTVLYVVILSACFLFIVPLFWMISTSFKTEGQIFVMPPEWVPDPWYPQNYVRAFTLIPLARYILNTFTIVLFNTPGSMLSAALVAYGLSRFRAPGLNVLFGLCIATMLLPGQVTMIPVYIMWAKFPQWFGLTHLIKTFVDTYVPLTLPAWFGGAFNIFFLRQYFKSIPNEFEEAAIIEGASRLRIFFHIIVPLSTPVLATLAIFSFRYIWNDFMGPLIYLSSPEKYTVTLGLQFFQANYVTEWGPLMAGSAVAVAPLVIAFFAAQKYFVQGLSTTSGIKG